MTTRTFRALSALAVLSLFVPAAEAQCDQHQDFSISYDNVPFFSVSRSNGSCACPNGFYSPGQSTLGNVTAASVSVQSLSASAGVFGDGSGLTNMRSNPGVASLAFEVATLNATLQSALQTIQALNARVAQQNATIVQLQAQLASGGGGGGVNASVLQQLANMTTLLNCLLTSSPCSGSVGRTISNPALSCLAIQQANGGPAGLTNGLYFLRPSGVASAFQAYCDFTTDGGGWTLALNYNHIGGLSPALVVFSIQLPLLGSDVLGVDETSSAYWGHASNSMFAAIAFTETRWYCRTGAHSRVLHFKSSNSACVSYLKTGSGACNGLISSSVLLSGHTGFLPGQLDNAYSNQGNGAPTEFTYYRAGAYHWGIRGGGSRWECDDASSSSSTIHRLFVR